MADRIILWRYQVRPQTPGYPAPPPSKLHITMASTYSRPAARVRTAWCGMEAQANLIDTTKVDTAHLRDLCSGCRSVFFELCVRLLPGSRVEDAKLILTEVLGG